MRRHAPDRVRLLAGAWVLMWVAACWNAPADRRIQTSSAVVRLGSADGRLAVAAQSRPVLPADTTTALLGPLPSGRIELAATLVGTPSGTAPTVASCRAALADPSNAAEAGSNETALEAAMNLWTETTIRLDEPIEERASLRLRCEVPAGTGVRWAQPLFLAGSGGEAAPLVVLVSIDTLRADHVSGFGAVSGQTPQLEAIGREGIRLLSAASEGTWTLPSHYAMLRSALFGFPLGRGRPTALPELLREHGFLTLASTGGGFVGLFFAFDEGFDHFDERWGATDDLPAQIDEIVARIEASSSVPTFVFFHTYAAHEQSALEVKWHAEHGSWRRFRPSKEEVAGIKEFYGTLVQRLDHQLGPLLDALRRASRERQVLLVVTSDHGEAFHEHGGFRHGYDASRHSLHDELTHIPLLVWGPGLVPGARESREPVMLSDIAPSLLDAIGVAKPGTMVGGSLWPLWSGQRSSEAAPSQRGAVSQIEGSWALRERTYKLIAKTREPGGGPLELYDLERDPGEQHDLVDRESDRAQAMLERLRARLDTLGVLSPTAPLELPDCPLCGMDRGASFLRSELSDPAHVPTHRKAVEEETRERLRALGYLD